MGAQDSTFTTLGGITDAFYKALSEPDSAKRAANFSALFAPTAQITAVVGRAGESKTQNGSWKEFLKKTTQFYKHYSPQYAEQEREVEYYLDLATMHGIVMQTATDKSSGKTYQQRLWMQLDVVFQHKRWFIANAIWVNEIDGTDINDALLQDTLWHKEVKK